MGDVVVIHAGLSIGLSIARTWHLDKAHLRVGIAQHGDQPVDPRADVLVRADVGVCDHDDIAAGERNVSEDPRVELPSILTSADLHIVRAPHADQSDRGPSELVEQERLLLALDEHNLADPLIPARARREEDGADSTRALVLDPARVAVAVLDARVIRTHPNVVRLSFSREEDREREPPPRSQLGRCRAAATWSGSMSE
ncbi:MAG: hypothetical protein U0353_30865 [Sandaracinus sp.]